MAPPAKRRKRNVVVSSPPSSEDGANENQHRVPGWKVKDLVSSSPVSGTRQLDTSKDTLPKPPGTPVKVQAKHANHPHNAAPIHLPSRVNKKPGGKSPSTSPEKSKAAKAKQVDTVKSKNLFTMFSNQAKRQASSVTKAKTETRTPMTATEDHEDIDSDADDIKPSSSVATSTVVAAAKKRGRELDGGSLDTINGSQKFMRKPPTRIQIPAAEDTRPWAERFEPTSLDELAVHKKKVADVKAWLDSVLSGQIRQRLLILKGAAGTGKTATVQLLAKAIGCEVLEWRNPIGSIASSDGFLSMGVQFEEFIGRGGKYGQLDIRADGASVHSKPEVKPLDRRKSLLLVEEFPNTFTRSSTTLQSFRAAILQYLAANVPTLSMMYGERPTDEIVTPLILVISETLLTTSTASADSFTAHRLLGPEILQHPGTTSIDFNPIAPTLLAKALELVAVKEARKSGRRKTPGPLVLKRLGEIGDIRSAIGSLEFLCLRGDENSDWGAKIAFTKGKAAKDTPMTKMEEQSLELVTRREASLGIFHAVGKVVYNKREESFRKDGIEDLPEWSEDRSRPKISQVVVDELIDETGTDTSTFISALHENYLLSCDANVSDIHDFTDIDHVNGCIDALSDSDLLCPSWDGSYNSSGLGGAIGGMNTGGDILRQDEICFQLAVRGILFALPYPVKRKAPPGSTQVRGGAQFKMFYPTSLKLWRPKEKIASVIDLWVIRMMRGFNFKSNDLMSGAVSSSKFLDGGVEGWGSRNPTSERPKANQSISDSTASDNLNPVQVSLGSSARKEMLLDRLPFMVIIAKAHKGGTTSIIREMEEVTAFTGIGGSSEEDEGGGEEVETTESWATDKPEDVNEVKRRPARGFKIGQNMGAVTVALEKRFAEQKLVLSDDDIEDD